jgi:O-methyltransferase
MSDFVKKVVYKYNVLGDFLGLVITKFQFLILYFYKEKNDIDLIKLVKNEVNFTIFPNEAYIILSLAKNLAKLDGDMAEVGVYQGGSSKIICSVKGEKNLHLFDTFEGLPNVSEIDTHFGNKFWKTKQFNNTSLDNVKKYLSEFNNVFFYKGLFPNNSNPVKDTKFSFVHLDVDLHKSTKDCLEFFYPRLVSGGIILTHDYHSQGVKTAFKEFSKKEKISLLEMSGTQCLIIKINKN